jgi:hypothetical protein
MQTHIELRMADGVYRCALGLAQIDELQTKTGAGIGALYARVLQGRPPGDIRVGHPGYAAFHLADLRETIRQGLIGGGEGLVDDQPVKVSALRANEILDRYITHMPLVEQWNLAAAILYALVEGYEPTDEEKPRAGEPGSGDDDAEKKSPTVDLTTPAH